MNLSEVVHCNKAAVTVTDAAEAMGWDPRTLNRAIDEGKVPAISMGRRKYVPVAPLLELVGLKWLGDSVGQ